MEYTDNTITPDWTVTKTWQGTAVEQAFKSLDVVFKLQGKVITKDELSEVILIELSGTPILCQAVHASG